MALWFKVKVKEKEHDGKVYKEGEKIQKSQEYYENAGYRWLEPTLDTRKVLEGEEDDYEDKEMSKETK